MRSNTKYLIGILLVGAIITLLLMAGIELNWFALVSSGKIYVVDTSNKGIPGATVSIVPTLETWHYMGDVWNGVVNACSLDVGFDYIINDYDINATLKLYAVDYNNPRYVDWFDLTGDGKIDGSDITVVCINFGYRYDNYPCAQTNVTSTDGSCVFNIAYAERGNKYYVNASANGYITKTNVVLDLKVGGSITLTKLLEPIATFTYTPQTPITGQTITFDASGSYSLNPNAKITKYTWNFGDGYTATITSSTTTHAYSKPGPFTVVLTVEDTYGMTGSYSEGIVVGTQSLSVSLSASPKSGYSPLTVSFTASVSGGVSPYTYYWDFDYNGLEYIFDSVTSSNTVSYTYSLPSGATSQIYTAVVVAKDTYGANGTRAVTISVELVIPKITLLTLLEFPPSTDKEVKVYVTDQNNNPLSGRAVALSIAPVPEINYGGTTKSTSSGSNGIAAITIISPPSSLYTYNVTITCEGATLTQTLKVLPQILVKTTEFNYEQTYKPGDYDFIYLGQTADKETGVLISDCSLASKQLKDDAGNVISDLYISYESSGGAFTFKAKVYDYFVSINPNFNYQTKTLILTLTFTKTGYVQGTLNVTAKIGPPTISAVISSTFVTVGTNYFKISLKNKYGQPYQGITASNVEVVITTPSGTTLSTLRELADKYYFDDSTKTITVSYTFEELGIYKITVNYINLPFTSPSQTFNVTCEQGAAIPPILTNPYVIGFIILIVLIILFSRRKKT